MDIMSMISANIKTTERHNNNAISFNQSNQNGAFRDLLRNKMNTYHSNHEIVANNFSNRGSQSNHKSQDVALNRNENLLRRNSDHVNSKDKLDDEKSFEAKKSQALEDDEEMQALIQLLMDIQAMVVINEETVEEIKTLLNAEDVGSGNLLEIKTELNELHQLLSEMDMVNPEEKEIELSDQLKSLINKLNDIKANDQATHWHKQSVANKENKLLGEEVQSKQVEIASNGEKNNLEPQLNSDELMMTDEEVDTRESVKAAAYQSFELDGQHGELANNLDIEEILSEDQTIVLDIKAQGVIQDVNSQQVQDIVPQSAIDPQQLIETLAGKVKLNINQYKSEMNFQLQPENLGKIAVRVSFDSGEIAARVYAESMPIKEIIETNLNQLRDALTQQGLSIGQLEVSVGQDPREFLQQFNHRSLKSSIKKSKVQSNIQVHSMDVSTGSTDNPYLATSQFDHLA